MTPTRRGVVLTGVGTVGSPLFELLVRQSVAGHWPLGVGDGPLAILDHDHVAAHNVAKSAIYEPADVGLRKVEVAASWAADIDPRLEVVPYPARVQDAGMGPFLNAALALICADNYAAKIEAFRKAWRAGVPLIMIGELAGEASLAARYRYYTPSTDCACLECGYAGPEYAMLGASFSCSGTRGRNGGGGPGRGPLTRLSAAYRLAACMIEDGERMAQAITGSTEEPWAAARPRPAEVRLLPAERQILTLWPKRNPACCFDHVVPEIRPLDESLTADDGATLTLGEAFAAAAKHLPEVRGVVLDHLIALDWQCDRGHAWLLPRHLVGGPRCPVCGEPGRANTLTRHIGREEPADVLGRGHQGTRSDTPGGILEHVLVKDLVPPGDVLRFVADEAAVHLALPAPDRGPSAYRAAGQGSWPLYDAEQEVHQ